MGRLKARLWGSGLRCCCCCGPLGVEGSLLDQSSPGGGRQQCPHPRLSWEVMNSGRTGQPESEVTAGPPSRESSGRH